VLDRTRTYPPRPHAAFKPHGLWLSVEDDPDDTWWAWCVTNEFHLTGLAHRTEVVLVPDDTVLHLATVAEIRRFSQEFRAAHPITPLDAIDWPRVQAQYAGLLIAPYQWSARLDLLWYYGWDCASACIWDMTVIQSARALE
jgi:hypothetical protein